ncbi:hypothetical protein ACFVWG_15970 [Kribbella sp. NPDC058245]|uniref:hypothetical protein n=1 Tax=Kribbella sp. NPDC058245 TaxID=3346399 RepID=UPI0036E4284F
MAPDPEPDAEPAEPAEPAEEAEAAEKTEPAKQSPKSLFWVCVAVTVLVGAFQYGHSLGGMDGFDVLAVLGLVVLTVLLLGLAGLYALCALERTDLRQRVFGRFDLFQVSTILCVAGVLVGVLIPPRTTTTLGLLLPFGIGYWLYHLNADKADADKAEQAE